MHEPHRDRLFGVWNINTQKNNKECSTNINKKIITMIKQTTNKIVVCVCVCENHKKIYNVASKREKTKEEKNTSIKCVSLSHSICLLANVYVYGDGGRKREEEEQKRNNSGREQTKYGRATVPDSQNAECGGSMAAMAMMGQ